MEKKIYIHSMLQKSRRARIQIFFSILRVKNPVTAVTL